jgi:catechol 2,3-dioxygenase-like lactoylglutathione lyase family enzyme
MGAQVRFEGRAVTISCTNAERSRTFYESVLGAVLLPGDGYGCPWLQLGSLTLTLMPNASKSNDPNHELATAMLWIETDDLASARSHFERNEVPMLVQDEFFLTIADPDGILIEVWERESSN